MLNLVLRGATAGMLMLLAAALWSDRRGSAAARLGAAFAVGIAAATLAAMPGESAAPLAWRLPLAMLATGGMFVFWLFTRALFDDAFRPRAWHLAAWIGLAAMGVLNCVVIDRPRPALASALGSILGVLPVAWALLAIAQSIASWRDDLVERRRELRTVIVAATALYTVGQLLAALIGGMPLKAVVESPWNAAGTALLTLIVAGRLIGLRETGLFAAAAPVVAAAGAGLGTLPAPGSAPDAAPDPVKADESRQLATLARLMTAERIYREPSLTIAALAHRMGLPEHRLRRLINRSLGHRNFNAYLNGHRIADIQRALRDPAQAATPVLTIAMDAGFQSLGPFNRAFKAATGLTPTEFRRGGAAGAEPAAALPPAETESA